MTDAHPELPLDVPTKTPGRHGFRLHPALDASLYVMPGSLARVRSWKAFCYVGDSSPEGKIGTMNDVGYVMVSLVDDTVIPIARGDEHHRGFDLLHDLATGRRAGRRDRTTQPLDISPGDYVPIWSHGTNYVYGTKDCVHMAAALRKWLSYGGRDGIVIGANDLRGRALSSSDLVARDGDFTIEPGALAPIGAKLYERLQALSQTLVALGADPRRIAMAEAVRLTGSLLDEIEPFAYQIGIRLEERTSAADRLREITRSGDAQALWELVFGFHGIKNLMHVYLRTETEADSVWSRDHLRSIWGDPHLAIDMLGRL